MIDLNNKKIILDNNIEYEIIEYVEYNNKIYIYLVNTNNEIDSMFKELITIDNDYYLEDINNKLFEDIIVKLFIEKFNNY